MKPNIIMIQLVCALLLLVQSEFSVAKNKTSDQPEMVSGLPTVYPLSDSKMAEGLDTTITVNSVSGLFSAVAVNGSKGRVTVLLQDGIYQLTRTLYIHGPSVTIKSKNGIRENVILQGDTMRAGAKVSILIHVDNSDFHLLDLTLRKCGWHLLQVAGELNADRPVIDNVVFQDAYQQLMKVSYSATLPDVGSDSGIVRNCLFEYTAGIGPQYYIGGIDAHNAKGWMISGNVFKGITSPDQNLPDPAIHFWTNSLNTLVEGNLIINCERGIGFGLGYARGHIGGIIRNNIIYHDGAYYHDVGIGVESCPEVQIYNNTVFMEGNYPNSIELRWSLSSNGKIYNNLCNAAIQLRDTSSADLSNNITDADSTWFVNSSNADLHLAPVAVKAINTGISLDTVKLDFDNQKRPWGSGYDIGADEYNGINFYSSSYSVTQGTSVELYWNVKDLSNITAFGAWSGSLQPADSMAVTPDTTSVYGIYGISGTDTAKFLLKIHIIPAIQTGITPNLKQKNELKIYPNPASNNVSIELPDFINTNKQNLTISFYNVKGQSVAAPVNYGDNMVTINTSHLLSGIYFYLLTVNSGYTASGKLIVSH